MSAHTDHTDHKILSEDKIKMNNITQTCRTIRESLPESAHNIPNRHIFQKEIAKDGFRNTKLVYGKVRRTLQRNKSKSYPNIPSSIQILKSEFEKPDIIQKYGYSYEEDERFYIGTVLSVNYEFTVFASEFIIKYIRDNINSVSRRYQMDGTFDSLPVGFYQLLIISIEYQNDLFPFVYCLMTRKTAEAYLGVFEYIESKLFKLEPAEFMTDFEEGMRLGIKKRWPTVPIRGCWFHLKQRINGRCLKSGLSKTLKTDANARTVKNMLQNIPLLPANLIREGFSSVQIFAQKNKLNALFADLFVYFERYWMRQNERNTISVADLNMRTTSSLESMNSVIQRSFPKQTHVFKFIDHLRLHETMKATDLYQLSIGLITNPNLERKRREDRERNEKIKLLSEKLKNKSISAYDFLEMMSAQDGLPSFAHKRFKIDGVSVKSISLKKSEKKTSK